MMRWIGRAATMTLAVLIVVGPPLAVMVWAPAVPVDPGSGERVQQWVQRPETVVAALIGSVVFTGWLLVALIIVRRGWHTVRALVRRATLPTAAQVTAGSMAGVAALTLPSTVVTHTSGPGPASTAPAGSTPDEPAHNAVRAGIVLPGGGWIPYRSALVVTALGAAVWLHRRQHYQPGPARFGLHHHDPDLQPLPGTVDVITAGLDTTAPPPDHPAGTIPDLPDGLVHLSGERAFDAARGLLVTELLSTALTRSPAAEVIIAADTLETLLGAGLLRDPPVGLRLDDPTRLAGPLLPSTGLHPGQLLMLIRRPDTSKPPGLEQPASSEQRVDRVTAVLVGGDSPAGHSWQVTPQGTVTDDGTPGGRRLCLLDQAAATDLLHLIRYHQAGTTTPPPPEPVVERPVRRARLQMLGGCTLRVDNTSVRLRRSAALQVLAYLALHPTGVTTLDLVRAVWPGLEPGTITNRLHTTLTGLRQQLQPTITEPVLRHDERYRLNRDLITVDLDHLHDALTAAATAVTDRQRQDAAQAVIDNYRGELAAGFSWPWLHPAREAIRRDVIDAHLLLAATAPPEQAAVLLRAALTVDPHNEALRHRVHSVTAAADAPAPPSAGDRRLPPGHAS